MGKEDRDEEKWKKKRLEEGKQMGKEEVEKSAGMKKIVERRGGNGG